MQNNISNRFCTRPFEFIEVNERQEVYSCCSGWLPKAIGNLRNSEEVDDIWNSNAAKEIRRSILDGSFRYCKHNECPHIGNNSLPYKRDITAPHLLDAITRNDGFMAVAPKIIGLSYDRTCNLACPSCRNTFITLNDNEWLEKCNVQSKIFASISNDTRLLIITGSGDPFASKLYRELLQSFEFSKYPNLKIHLMTNGQLLTPFMWANIANAHNAIDSIQISIDAASKKTYNQLRLGGSFDKLLSNLGFISTIKREKKLKFVSIEFVVQKGNFQEMKEFINMGISFNCDRIGFASIRNWGTFSNEVYDELAIHKVDHPDHKKLIKMLQDSVFQEPIVDLGNLTTLLAKAN